MESAAVAGLLEAAAESEKEERALAAQAEGEAEAEAMQVAAALEADRVTIEGGVVLPGPKEGFESHLASVKSLIASDPARVAQVLKGWILSDE
jgi:flagellar M-ring protein FliF